MHLNKLIVMYIDRCIYNKLISIPTPVPAAPCGAPLPKCSPAPAEYYSSET